ncbi:hypothetical protein [Shewanella baltica]|uniref:hypothetical protein n=1 Tax=Shewanella baltica TaxID=62322 RepID=UPI003D7A6B9E
MSLEKEGVKLLEKGGIGSVSLVALYFLFNIQNSMAALSDSVDLNDKRLALIEYQISKIEK